MAPTRYALGALGLVSLSCTSPVNSPVVVGVTGPAGDPVAVYCGPRRTELSEVERISPRMSLGEISDVLGPPARESGSSQVILEWDCTDGRRFYVSTNQRDPSSKPVELGFTR